MSNNNVKVNSRPGAKCPMCENGIDASYKPFCSKRCADLDLHKWLSGAYAIPAQEEDDSAYPKDHFDESGEERPPRLH